MFQRKVIETDSKLKRGIKLNVIHLNVLADHLCSDFNGFDAALMTWGVRSQRLLQLIQDAEPDVLSLVEVDHFVDFWLPSIFERCGLVLGGFSRKPGKEHGVALFYNPLKLSVRKVENSPLDVAAVFCRFNEGLTVVTTHLKAKDKERERGRQIEILHTYMFTPSKHLLLMGDFNTTPEEETIQKWLKRFHLKHVAQLDWTTWKSRPPTEWQPGGEVKRAIDHFFTNHPLHVLSFLDTPDDADVKESGLLPGTKYPSDHLLIKMTYLLD